LRAWAHWFRLEASREAWEGWSGDELRPVLCPRYHVRNGRRGRRQLVVSFRAPFLF